MNSVWKKILISIGVVFVIAAAGLFGYFADELFKQYHECDFAQSYSYDETYHWFECTEELCDEVKDKTEHIDDNIDGICDTCLYGSKVLVNGVNYNTLQEAVDSYTGTPITITLFEDTIDSGLVVDGQEIIIDLNGKTYTPNEGVGSTGTKTLGFQFLQGSKVTIKNGTIKAGQEGIKMLIQNYADLTLEDVILDGRGLIGANPNYVLSNNCGNIIIKGNTTIIADEGDFALDACRYATYTDGVIVSFVDFTGSILGQVEISGNDPAKTGSAKIIKPDGTELTENGIYTI